jgi:hypothetical protein
MQRVGKYHCPRERQAERNSALAKTGKRRRFILAGQSRFGDPGRQLGELGIIHITYCALYHERPNAPISVQANLRAGEWTGLIRKSC